VIIASVFHHFFSFNIFEFILIVFCAFLSDLDVFFAKYAKDHNHRNLISHSIIPSIIIIIIGIIFSYPAIIISGLSYFTHITVDMFDWGTNFFYFPQKTFGPRFLIRKEEHELAKYLAEYKNPSSYFDFKYYKSKISITIEILLFIFMMVSIVILAFEFILITPLYFLGLYFHLSRHFHLKKIESKKK
jgi:hypothetical protein